MARETDDRRPEDPSRDAGGTSRSPRERRTRVLFLCTGNACRSPMAEGLLRRLAPERYEALSAGSHPAGFVHPLAVRVMAEIGIDISGHISRDIREYLPRPSGTLARAEAGGRGAESPAPHGPLAPPDVIVSLSDFARAHCPRFPPGTGWIHWPVFDPILALGTEDFLLSVFRGVREDLRVLVQRAVETGAFERPDERFGPEPAKPA